MPRAYVKDSTDWGEGSDPRDYCRTCWHLQFAPDDDGDEHPDYADHDYTCETCGRALRRIDN